MRASTRFGANGIHRHGIPGGTANFPRPDPTNAFIGGHGAFASSFIWPSLKPKFEGSTCGVNSESRPRSHRSVELKTVGGARTIDLDPETVAILRTWREEQPTRKLGRDAHTVFTYKDGSRVALRGASMTDSRPS